VRLVAFDIGRKRTGVAVSDPSGTLARPLTCLTGPEVLADALAIIERLAADDEGLGGVVVGLPSRLDGSPNEQTPHVLAFANALRARCGIPVALQDERLSSLEAERRLAVRERDWRRRKAQLDAAAAAVILQDYLDAHAAVATVADNDDDIEP